MAIVKSYVSLPEKVIIIASPHSENSDGRVYNFGDTFLGWTCFLNYLI